MGRGFVGLGPVVAMPRQLIANDADILSCVNAQTHLDSRTVEVNPWRRSKIISEPMGDSPGCEYQPEPGLSPCGSHN